MKKSNVAQTLKAVFTGLFISLIMCFATGCQSFRFAPGEVQKQNAWLHNRTAAVTAETARAEQTSEKLQALTQLGEKQSMAFVSYYGLPQEFPPSETAEQILDKSNIEITENALIESAQRPDAWQMADAALELGIGIFALLGGVYGTRAVSFLHQAKTKSQALQEIITGNELFKKQNTSSIPAFKQAHSSQSSQTRQLVAQMKA